MRKGSIRGKSLRLSRAPFRAQAGLDRYGYGIADLQEWERPQSRTPDGIQDFPIPDHGCEGEIMLRQSRLALLEVLIEHLIARAPRGAIDELMQVAKIRKFLHEGECAQADALLDTEQHSE
jgi:hypothetical protein